MLIKITIDTKLRKQVKDEGLVEERIFSIQVDFGRFVWSIMKVKKVL